MIEPIQDTGLVEVTPEELAAWAVTHGTVMSMTKADGRLYRVLQPAEFRAEYETQWNPQGTDPVKTPVKTGAPK